MTAWWIGGYFLVIFLFSGVLSARYDDFSDIQGPYCANTRCCEGREDNCAVPILGTLCYCDEFCNVTRVDDCCPDYWFHCRGIPLPTTTTTTTTPAPAPVITCSINGQVIPIRGSVKDNCNVCKCERVGEDVFDTMCETNVCLVDPDLNQKINSDASYGWTAEKHNEFWGRTLDDGVKLRLGTLQPHRFVMNMNPVRIIYDPTRLPRSFDAETKWPSYISSIKDQGWCGSSWAISTADVASDRYAIISEGTEHEQLSAQNLISCQLRGQQSCNGGYLDKAWSFIRKFGLVDEECFPYTGTNKKCTIKRHGKLLESGCKRPLRVQRESRYRVSPAYRLGNETDIMYEITRSGPVQATMKVHQDFFSYKGGIYRHSNLGDVHKVGYHSVRIVGWGEENSFRGIQKYWKVANSWGPQWGENGFFRIAKGTNECEIETFVLGTWPEVEKKLLIRDKYSR